MRRPVSTTRAVGVAAVEPGVFDVRATAPATPEETHAQGFGRFPLPVRALGADNTDRSGLGPDSALMDAQHAGPLGAQRDVSCAAVVLR